MGWCWLDSSGCLMGFYRVVPVLTGFYWVLLGFIEFRGFCLGCHRAALNGVVLVGLFWVFTGFLPSCTGFNRILLGFTGFYWVLSSFVAFVWAVIELH